MLSNHNIRAELCAQEDKFYVDITIIMIFTQTYPEEWW